MLWQPLGYASRDAMIQTKWPLHCGPLLSRRYETSRNIFEQKV